MEFEEQPMRKLYGFVCIYQIARRIIKEEQSKHIEMEGNESRPYRPLVVTTNRAGEAEIVTAPANRQKAEWEETFRLKRPRQPKVQGINW